MTPEPPPPVTLNTMFSKIRDNSPGWRAFFRGLYTVIKVTELITTIFNNINSIKDISKKN